MTRKNEGIDKFEFFSIVFNLTLTAIMFLIDNTDGILFFGFLTLFLLILNLDEIKYGWKK
ncbi:MAG: hypothetical protein KKB31_00790 [Nanoarchaeota archaeon]|nr:hypothetical protein [Nanoarchaeota archaeon]